MRPSGNEKVMQSVNDTSSVQIMGRHHLIEGAHGSFQHPGVLLTLPLPLPIVDPPAKGFLQDELNLPSAAVGHQQLNVFPLRKQVALRHELERKDGFSQIPVGDVSDVPQDARRRVQALFLADGFQSLFNHQPGERGMRTCCVRLLSASMIRDGVCVVNRKRALRLLSSIMRRR